jgi:hypothetical protein
MSDENESVDAIDDKLRAQLKRCRSMCRCGGYGFFWGSEIRGWKGSHGAHVVCIQCGRLFWFEKLWYWFMGYRSNDQIQSEFKSINGKCEDE